MTTTVDQTELTRQKGSPLAVLLCLHFAVICASSGFVHNYYAPMLQLWPVRAGEYLWAILRVSPLAMAGCLFALRSFSFGYAVSYSFYTIIIGYLWFSTFSTFNYNHSLGYISAIVSGLGFFFPAMFITAPIKQRLVISGKVFDGLLFLIIISAIVILAIAATYNLNFIGFWEVGNIRDQLQFPKLLEYALGLFPIVLLPFAFACDTLTGRNWRAAIALLLIVLFYPVTLSKLTLFAAPWLLSVTLGSRFASTRTIVILSLLLPPLLGLIVLCLFQSGVISPAEFYAYFSLVNFRMIALPSSALDIYSDFFSNHSLTGFCQINLVKLLIDCPYHEPLAIVLRQYRLGNFNASLLATEGIASVGLLLAPISAFGCGLVISLGNRLSSDLPHRFVLISSTIVVQVLMNVPLTITMLTYGGALLFVLWYLTPRSLFKPL